jgi:biotin carboxylase
LVAATTGYQIRAFAEAGRQLGIELVLATDRCHILEDPWGDRALPVRFDRPVDSFGQFEALAFDGIAAVGDRPAIAAAAIAEKLGLPFHPPAAVQAAADKHLARERFSAAGLVSPEHYRFEKNSPPDGARFYPCVLKPLHLSGSRGVIRADNDAEFAVAAARIRTILEKPDVHGRSIQVERFIGGPEFALEGLVTAGRLETLAIFDKPDPLDGPYFEETIYATPSRHSAAVQDDLRNAAQRAVTALGLWHGPIHAEMRLAAEGVFVLEVAARPIGGLCSRALAFASGATLEELILRHAVGEIQTHGEAAPGGVMMIPIPKPGIFQSSAGIEEALAVPGISDIVISAKTGQALQMLPEGSSYLGFIFAHGPHAEPALRKAHERLSFVIQTALPVSW